MRRLIGLAIKAYRHTPLYPQWGNRLAKLLSFVGGGRSAGAPVVHDLGPFKMSLDLTQIIDSQLYYSGSFEPKTERTIEKLVQPGQTVIDVGANIGYITLHLAHRVGTSGSVIAFEPTDWAYQRLRTNIGLNHMPQIATYTLGVGDIDRQGLPIEINSSYRLDGTTQQHQATIDIARLDTFLETHPVKRLDFIKIDTDGMELRVIEGARQTLQRFSPAILMEIGRDDLIDAGASPQALMAALTELGYRFFHEETLAPFDDLAVEIARLPDHKSLNVVARRAAA
jgi:FkbM family methyltransferase